MTLEINQTDLAKIYCTLEQAIELKRLKVTIQNPKYYWVNLAAWQRPYELMTAKNAEYRAAETKYTAFVDFDDTYPACEKEHAVQLLSNIATQV